MADEQRDPRDVYASLGTRWVRACDNPVGGNAYIGAAVVALLVVAIAPSAAGGNMIASGFGLSILAIVWMFLRAARMGVYVNREGVLVRRFWSPKVELDWRTVDRFDVVRRHRMGAEIDQVRLVADGAEFWLPLVIHNVGRQGAAPGRQRHREFPGDIRVEATPSPKEADDAEASDP